MISAYARLQEQSGVRLTCDKKCIALRPDSDWQYELGKTADSIVFIDEDAGYVSSEAFAAAMKASDNYYVIFSREPLYNLPYSVEEIYEIKTSNKLHQFKKRYKQQKGYLYAKAVGGVKAAAILTEDSHSGFQFYQHLYNGTEVKCASAGSNSSIFSWLQKHHEEGVFVIADGAAFGAEMVRLMALQHQYPDKITICLPESFEWLILKSGLMTIPELSEMLENPSAAIESSQYFSWENFFTDYLVQNTKGTHYAYSKAHLHSFYTVHENSEKIVALIAENMPKPFGVKPSNEKV